MRIVFAGTPAVALPALEAVLASRHEVVAVLTRPAAPVGRGKRMAAGPVGARGAELGLETLTPERASDPALRERLAELAPDCCPVVAYGALLPQPLIDVPRHGFVNLHFSLLPAWRGAAPVQRAVIAGDRVTGATTFQIVRALDAGPTYLRLDEPVWPTDTAGDLLGRLAERGAGLLVQTLDGIEDGTLAPVPQPGDGVSLAPKLEVADARVDWTAPAVVVDRLVRGCTPAPGAWTTVGADRLKLGPLSLVEPGAGPTDAEPLRPGALRVGRREVLVGAGDGVLRLGLVQPPGKRPMPAADWARGAALGPSPVLGG